MLDLYLIRHHDIHAVPIDRSRIGIHYAIFCPGRFKCDVYGFPKCNHIVLEMPCDNPGVTTYWSQDSSMYRQMIACTTHTYKLLLFTSTLHTEDMPLPPVPYVEKSISNISVIKTAHRYLDCPSFQGGGCRECV